MGFPVLTELPKISKITQVEPPWLDGVHSFRCDQLGYQQRFQTQTICKFKDIARIGGLKDALVTADCQ
jgi:hypothetical protein